MNRKQSLAIASTSVLAAGMAQGAVVYSGPISYELAGNYSFPIDLNADGTIDYQVWFDNNNQLKPFIDCRPNVVSGVNPNSWVLSKANGGSPVTPYGTRIDAGYAAAFPTNKVGYLYQQYDGGKVVGDWPSTADTDAYVGLAFTDGTSTNYGWAHFIYKAAASSKSLVVVDYAYENTANTPIVTGETVTPDAPVIFKNPQPRTVAAGSSVEMSVVAMGNPAPTYQWRAGAIGSGLYTNLVDNGNVSGTASDTLRIASASLGDTLDYVVVVANSLGSATSSPPAKLQVNEVLISGPTPSQEQIFAGQTAHFSIQLLSGVSPTYQWRKDGVNLSDSATVSGTKTLDLSVGNLAAGNAGNYDVVVTTLYGAKTSAVASLTVVATNGGGYEHSLLADGPVSYYRLNEVVDPLTGNTNAFDNVGAKNGVYGTGFWNANGYPSAGVAGPRPADGFAGFGSNNTAALIFPNNPDSRITLPPWNLNTNTVTLTAWVNPQGHQVSGAAIVYTRSTNNMVCGLAYYGNPDANGEYSLGYNWNDNFYAYFWTSGLTVPQQQWSLVSLVITPTNAMVYVMNTNGIQSAVHALAHPVQSFADTVYIGTDPDDVNGGRNFNGVIDEVGVFNRSLAYDEVLRLYARGVGMDAYPPSILKQPLAQQVWPGQTAHLTVTANGNLPLGYQWKAGSGGVYTNVTDSLNVSGSSTPTLTVQNASAANVADYVVVVTNSGGAVTSSVASLTLASPATNVYASALLSVHGLAAYYQLDDLGDPAANAPAMDYVGGFNGVYGAMVQNGNPRYNIAGPTAADGFSGFGSDNKAALFANGVPNYQGQITLPALNLNTNTVTFTAWINPAGPQAPYAGILFCRAAGGMVSGLDYIPATNDVGETNCYLGYHWNDSYGSYTWQSNLMPPSNQWSFVSLVITPTDATIQIVNTNGTQVASRQLEHAVQNFDAPTLIGNDSYDASGSRCFSGAIDNVAIFGTALSSNQLLVLYDGGRGIAPTLPSVPLILTRSGNDIQLSWTGAGVLLEATHITGPWTTNSSASSPYTTTPAEPQKFYRLQLR